MRRFLTPLVIVLGLLVALSAFVLFGEHGRASVQWLGWRADTTASALVGAAVLLGAVVALAGAGVVWLARTPRRLRRARTSASGQGRIDALTRGFAALAAGDAADARRQAARAREGLPAADPLTGLVRLLSARAADANGEREAATLAFEALLAQPQTAPAGRRGLADIARRLDDRPALIAHADAAYAQSAGAIWAWRILFEDRLKAGDVAGARALIDTAERRGTLPPGGAGEVRAALAGLAQDADRQRLDLALTAAELPAPPLDDEPLVLPRKNGRRRGLPETA